jgi:hypothetical protein
MRLGEVAVEQHIGTPVRFVAAAHVEHECIGIDGDADAPPVERAQTRHDAHGTHR